MEVLVILVPLALGLGLIGLAAFLWSLKSGQTMISKARPGVPSRMTNPFGRNRHPERQY
jgi:hypothetical protein